MRRPLHYCSYDMKATTECCHNSVKHRFKFLAGNHKTWPQGYTGCPRGVSICHIFCELVFTKGELRFREFSKISQNFMNYIPVLYCREPQSLSEHE